MIKSQPSLFEVLNKAREEMTEHLQLRHQGDTSRCPNYVNWKSCFTEGDWRRLNLSVQEALQDLGKHLNDHNKEQITYMMSQADSLSYFEGDILMEFIADFKRMVDVTKGLEEGLEQVFRKAFGNQ